MKEKRKFIGLTSILLIAVMLLGGCGKKEENNVSRIENPEAGLVFQMEKEYLEKGIQIEGPYEDGQDTASMGIMWYYKPVTDKLFDDIKKLSKEEITAEVQEEFYEKMSVHSKCIMGITLVEEKKYETEISNGKKPEELSLWDNAEEFGRNEGYVYLVSFVENDTDGMKEEEKAQYEECAAYMKTVKENLSFMEKKASLGIPEEIPAFTAKDLEGNTVTESIFGEKDLTVINIWGTFCGPCIEEMPELGEWAKEMPDNVQLVGLISDISGDGDKEHRELAESIVEKANADFQQIIVNQDFDVIMKWVTGVPTTLFVDKDGKIVGTPIIGANVQGYKDFVEEYLNGQ